MKQIFQLNVNKTKCSINMVTLYYSLLGLTLDGLSTFFLLVEEEEEGTKVLAFLFNISNLTDSLKSGSTGNR